MAEVAVARPVHEQPELASAAIAATPVESTLAVNTNAPMDVDNTVPTPQIENGMPSPPAEPSERPKTQSPSVERVHVTRTATGSAPPMKREREAPTVSAPTFTRTHAPGSANGKRATSYDEYYDGPPTPVSLPSFVQDEPLSEDSDSSSDEDSEGEQKPPREPKFDSKGRERPTPSYYYDPEYDISGAPIRKRGRRGGMKGIPVFEPTMEEFKAGFYDYVKRIEKYGMRSGIVKVVPPKQWSEQLPNVDKHLRKIRLKDAIEQHMVGSAGLYRVTNVAKSRIWNAAQWKETSLTDKYQTPDFVKDAQEKGDRGTRSTVAVQASRKRTSATAALATKDDDSDQPESSKSGPGNRRRSTRNKTTDVPPVEDKENSGAASEEASDVPATTNKTKRKPLSAMAKAEPTDAEWRAFMQKYDELPNGMKKEDYTIEMMREIERRYWRGLVFGNAPMYGADMAGSIFDNSTKHWNVAKLGDLLGQLAPADCQIPGVVSPYLYFGMWRSTFAWHVEDADLYSINYIHFGAPKFWYAVPQEQASRFERVMEGWFPTDRAKCSQFLRHKAFLASPHKLAEAGVTLNRCVQLPGEFILTYPKGYHSGFNIGFNCAESINFATERWIPIGQEARSCTCVGDSVSINVEAWLHEASESEQKAKDPAYRKRSYEQFVYERDAKRRKLVRHVVVPPPPPPMPVQPKQPKMTKKAQIELELQQKLESYVCALCPDLSTEALVEIREPGRPPSTNKKAHRVCVMFTPSTWIDTDPATGKEIVRGFDNIEKARWSLKCQLCPEKYGCKVQCTRGKCIKAFHVTCALKEDSGVFIDATIKGNDDASVSVLKQAREEVDAEKQAGSPISSKVAIPQRAVPGPPSAAVGSTPAPPPPALPPIQVPAIVNGVQTMIWKQPAAPKPPAPKIVDFIEMGNMKVQVLCRQHNPAWQKLEAERRAAELKEKVMDLKENEQIGVRTPGGVFEVTLTAKYVDRESVAVVFGDGKRSEIKWKNILWIDAAELKLRQEAAERARREKDTKMYVYDHRPIQPTKRSAEVPGAIFPPRWHAYAPPPVPGAAYYAALPGQPHATVPRMPLPYAPHYPSTQYFPVPGPIQSHLPAATAPIRPAGSIAGAATYAQNYAQTHFGQPGAAQQQQRPVAFPPSPPRAQVPHPPSVQPSLIPATHLLAPGTTALSSMYAGPIAPRAVPPVPQPSPLPAAPQVHAHDSAPAQAQQLQAAQSELSHGQQA